MLLIPSIWHNLPQRLQKTQHCAMINLQQTDPVKDVPEPSTKNKQATIYMLIEMKPLFIT